MQRAVAQLNEPVRKKFSLIDLPEDGERDRHATQRPRPTPPA